VLSGNVHNYYGGMGNIIIEVLNAQNEIVQSAITSNNGFYIAENLPIGQFTVRCRVESPYVCDTSNRIVQILDGQVTEADFYLYIPPIPSISQLPEIRGECSVNVTAMPTATDQWGNTLQGSATDPLTYIEPGTYIIRWLYTDASGKIASQTQTVTVYDNIAPIAGDLTLITGQCSVQITTPPTAIDNCAGPVSGTTTFSLPHVFNQQGTYQIIWTFSDGHGNSSIQNQTVIVADNIAPVPDIINLPDITGTGSVSIFTIPTATDNCIGPVNGTTTDPLTYQQPGTYFITWNYSDGNGNTSSQQQKVVIVQSDRCITNLAARAKLDKIQLTWTNDGSSDYHVFRSTQGAATGFQQIAITTSTYSTYLDAGLVIGQRYWYKVVGDGNCITPSVVSAVPEERVRR
jgi:hypothetical protein